MSSGRMIRVNRLLQQALSQLLTSGLNDPRVRELDMLTVVDVRTSPDLRHARVSLSMTGSSEQKEAALQALSRARGHLRTVVARQVELRYVPELKFVEDLKQVQASRVEEILREIRTEGTSDSVE